MKLSRDETLVSRDESLVSRDESLVSRDENLVSRDEILVSREGGNLLLSGTVCFLSSNKTQKFGMEEHYASWLETMFSQFGHKWLCLHRGPVRQFEVDPLVEVNTNKVVGSNVVNYPCRSIYKKNITYTLNVIFEE